MEGEGHPVPVGRAGGELERQTGRQRHKRPARGGVGGAGGGGGGLRRRRDDDAGYGRPNIGAAGCDGRGAGAEGSCTENAAPVDRCHMRKLCHIPADATRRRLSAGNYGAPLPRPA
ncbi:hypothetical protein GCM10010441_13240 [Kitasatospora paracochleata]